jgi:hypothetical protein
MALTCLASVVIEEGEKIKKPRGTNCYRVKSGRCIFSKTNPSLEKNYKWWPKNAEYISYPNYRKHGERWINYGDPTFYDCQGNRI